MKVLSFTPFENVFRVSVCLLFVSLSLSARSPAHLSADVLRCAVL
jgi:hypothetical protein